MPVLTFKLADFGVASMAPLEPRVYFRPSGPAVMSSGPSDLLLASRDVDAWVDADGDTWHVALVSSGETVPEVRYRLVVDWLDEAGNFVDQDCPQWEIFMPTADARLVDLINAPRSAYWVWVGATPPPNPVPGMWWLNDTTGDLFEWGA